GWPISTLSEIAGITRDAYYKWIHRKANIHDDEQAELLKAILELEKKHKWTLGYLGMTKQLAFENKLDFKAGLKRVTNCMRNHGIKANIRKKKHNWIK
ncbi:IS3 family transposase, partial [Mediterraneibacter sp. 210702-DFI.5.30]|uniref:IS3 family transposase n=1 Tax=Mediterraneibacter sp. 210702-DFI.5.30 TaxID=2883232 RepID=UPI001D067AFE